MRISLEEARLRLVHGEVVAVPTETVYGLAASLDNPAAINQIYSLKGRPCQNPLIIHVANIGQIQEFVVSMPDDLKLLADEFWPGPLTVILPINPELIPAAARANLPTAAFRIPAHSLTLALLEWVGPLVMPSANLSGKPSATCREHVESDFGHHFPVLDGGKCEKGVESTILYQKEGQWQIVRVGALSPEKLTPFLGYSPAIANAHTDHAPVCPGQLFRHYAPKARLLLNESPYLYKGAVLGFSDRIYSGAKQVITLGPLTDANKVAENLYSALRQLDDDQIAEVCVDMGFPDYGLWITIAERLTRAAS